MESTNKGDRVRRAILDAGVRLWEKEGQQHVTASRLGREMALSHNAIRYHFGSSAGLVTAVANHAIANGYAKVICQLIASGHPAIDYLTNAERTRYLATMKKPA